MGHLPEGVVPNSRLGPVFGGLRGRNVALGVSVQNQRFGTVLSGLRRAERWLWP